MRLSFLLLLIFLVSGSNAYSHGGHAHSAPANTSRTKFGSSSESESPLSLSFKVRSGYEFGSFVGALPSVNSYFGNEEVSLNLNYEFQARQFDSSQPSEYEDRDYNNHFTALAKKTVSDKLNFSLTGEYEVSQAVRIARMINDFNYTALNSNLSYKLENEWTVTGGYLFSMRKYPNGTYLTPSSSPSGVGEPIVPNDQPSATEPITLEGITDNLNEVSLALGGDLGSQTLNLEGKAIINNSDLATRKYNAQALKAGIEKMLFSRIFGQVSYAIESRAFADRTDRIDTLELGLQKDLSARMSVFGIARSTQTVSEENASFWEGYAQLQYAF